MSKKPNEMTRVLEYLELQNRPYSLNDIFLNLHKDIGKTALQKCLDQLVASGEVKEKLYGKQKVYVADQSRFPAVDEQALKALEQRVAELTESVDGQKQAVQQAEAALKAISSTLTTKEVIAQISQLRQQNEAMESRLVPLKTQQSPISKEERQRLERRRSEAVLQWRRRKRIAREVLDAILEGYPKSKKELYEDIGIETDEDLGVKMPQ
ncbi:homologous-pairing protein 2 homolog [Hyalella azteca]|uniref:Homologous-pairing protein 2 homolog n=1 Tax=Hyalella azteca TaxID=294128 RepID=A0A8B7N9A7_HYAAZ|nr:homologous-pairing protein 2 homolog [Hyalella azteca]